MAARGKEEGDPLAVVLRAAPPAALAALSPADREALAAAIGAAVAAQDAQLADAGRRALDQIPWPLRGAVRKLMGGRR